MPFTSAEIAAQMIQQLRVLDPAISAEPGTPERKILDTVAVKVAESQLDLTALQGGLNIDSKIGSNLDNFLALLNFGRQQAVAATGFVTFRRASNAPAPRDIRIPAGTRVIAPDPMGDVTFRTTFDVVLKLNTTSIVAPIIAVLPGTNGNVAANRITQFINVEGVYTVTNDAPTSNGLSREDDDAFKTRFKNTVFRNVSGTTDQYLALAVATPFTTKANVIGPISRYREYVQVPDTDDLASSGNGIANEWTTAMSTIPFSKYVYDTIPYYVSNGKLGAEAVFYRPNADFRLNTLDAARDRGDGRRQKAAHPGDPYWDPASAVNDFRPSLTFLNVVPAGSSPTIMGVRAGDVLLFEHSYLSSASRNDWVRNVTNCVDVFIDGGNNVVADAVVPRPTSANMFVNDVTHRFHYDNFRRVGEAQHRPVIGNVFTPLFFQPATDIPDMLTVGGINYHRGYHFWLVEDRSELGGTVRARNGIEWDKYLPGQAVGQSATDPTVWTGPTIIWGDGDAGETGVAPALEVLGYTYDKNINDLQASLDSNKQTTTDALAHKALTRYFKLDITAMYAPGVNTADANATIRAAVQSFFDSQYFGSTVQLSDLLNVIHNVSAVDNVRWSRDVPTTGGEIDTSRIRVVEVNQDGSPLTRPVLDSIVWGATARKAQFRLYLPGQPTGGTFNLTVKSGATTATTNNTTLAANALTPLSPSITPSQLRASLGAPILSGGLNIVIDPITGSGTPASPWIIAFTNNGVNGLGLGASLLTGGLATLNTDFYLEDDELPSLPDGTQAGDTAAGLIIRPRAQSTWVRL